jgi:phosphocarrier protein FPr
MIGIVVVSHSAQLAEGICELVRQVGQERVRIAPAGGTADPEHPMGTDAFQVLRAIESVYSEEGVLLLMDLGSAVLSAGTALDFLDETRRSHVRLCPAPLVEGAVAAASLAAAGATLDEIDIEARNALLGKVAELPGAATEHDDGEPSAELRVKLVNPLGLHARPAAQLVRLARRSQSRITIENLTAATGPVRADSINGVLTLGARQSHELKMVARGPEARDALSALAAFIESGCGERDLPTIPAAMAIKAASPNRMTGIPASAGVAIGPLVRLRASAVATVKRAVGSPETERKRLDAAIRGAQEETKALSEWSKIHVGVDEAGIFDAQLLFLDDPELQAEVSRLCQEQGLSAEAAWESATGMLAGRLSALADPYLRARVADVRDVAERVLRKLTGDVRDFQHLEQPAILTAHDLTPSQVNDFNSAMTLALCLEAGSASSHSIILARAMGIPVVSALGPGISLIAEGTLVGVDGAQGIVWISPNAGEVRELEGRRNTWLAARRAMDAERRQPAATRDGLRIRVLANISSVAEAAEAITFGAEGVGVLRTEFLFLRRTSAPGEDEQAAAYRAIAESLAGRPLCVRTLDIGGDKSLPSVEIGEEANPALGWRGIRVTLSRRDLFRTQLRAILRAGANHALDLLLPMVVSLDELRESRALVAEAEAELERDGLAFHKHIRIGVMIEVPAAVAIADQLAREADFFSIGTNDLIQYAMAADRTNARVAPIADPFQPAVLRLIRQTIDAARAAGIPVALCGELAADPLATPLLLGLGLDEFSVSAPLIRDLKHAISSWTIAESEALAREALAMDSAREVRNLLLKC